jgi:hypothetical protein
MYERMCQLVKQSQVVHTDDTSAYAASVVASSFKVSLPSRAVETFIASGSVFQKQTTRRGSDRYAGHSSILNENGLKLVW